MADNTNPQVVKFANEQARHVCDLWASFYNAAKVFQTVWAGQNLTSLVPATADFIADGSDVDGRGRVTNNQLNSLKTIVDAFVTDAEASSNAKRNAFFAAAVNPRNT